MDGWVKIGTELDTKSFDSQIKDVENQLEDLDKRKKILKLMASGKLEGVDTEEAKQNLIAVNSQYEKLLNKLGSLRQKQADLNRTDLTNLTDSLNKVGDKVDSVVKKIGKWAMAVFGIRTAYSLVQRAMSTVSQYDDQIKTNTDYIGFILANSIKPLIEWLINGAYSLLVYTNHIAKAWFGVDLFANATAENFKKASKNAKELQKVIMGFDEMNIINDNGGTGAQDVMPNFPKPDDVPIPKWVDWIAKNGNLVKGILLGIGAAIVGIKIASFLKGMADIAGGFGNLASAGTLSFGTIGLAVLAVIVQFMALWFAISNLIDNWENMSGLMKTVSLVFIGLTTAIMGPIVPIGMLIAKLITEEKAIKSVEQAQKDLKTAQDEYATATDEYIAAVDRQEAAMKKLKDAQDRTGLSGENLYNQVQNGTLDYKDMTDAQREVYKAYIETDKAQASLDETTKKMESSKKKLTSATWDEKLAVAADKGEYNEYKKAVLDAFNKGELKADEARTALEKAMSGMSEDARKTFMEDLPTAITDGIEPSRFSTAGQKLKTFFSKLWGSIKDGWNNFWAGVGNFFGFSGGGITTGSSGQQHSGSGIGFASGGITTKLASGAIINNPGRGVPLGRAIGGEAGSEGIIPLTDSQAMETLGATIGRYITINANITNSMDGRVIGREVRRIQGENDFLMNR